MDRTFPLTERVFTLLCDQRSCWLCDRCIAQILRDDVPDEVRDDVRDVVFAVADLYRERTVRLIRGVCFLCGRTDYVASLDMT